MNKPSNADFFNPSLFDATTRATVGILDKQPWPDSAQMPQKDIRHSLVLNDVYDPSGQTPLRVIVMASRPVDHDCHVCRSQISLFAWSSSNRNGPAKLMAHSVFVQDLGAWGEAPQATLKRLPEGSLQIQLRDSFTAQGVKDLLELAYQISDETFVEVYRQETHKNSID